MYYLYENKDNDMVAIILKKDLECVHGEKISLIASNGYSIGECLIDNNIQFGTRIKEIPISDFPLYLSLMTKTSKELEDVMKGQL